LKNFALICIFFFHLALQPVATYSQHYTGTFLHTANGLPSSELLCIERDKQGYLWIGSNVGITKYDGYSFETFQYSSDNQLIGKVNTVKEDRQDRLWIGTDAGLFMRNGNTIRKFSIDTDKAQGINKIFEDKYSNIYLATEQGPACIPKVIADTAVKVYVQDFILPGWTDMSTGLLRINLINKAEDETLYFSSNYKLYQYKNNVIKQIYHYDKTHDIILQIIPVNANKVIFYAALSGWHKIEDGSHVKLHLKEMLKPGIVLAKTEQWVLGSHTVFQFDPLHEIVTTMIDLGQFDALWVSDMLTDPQNIIWVATHEGLLKLQPSVFKTYPAKKFPIVDEIYSMYETSKKQFLMGGNRGKLILFQKDDLFEFSPLSPVVPFAEILSIVEDDKGWLWFGTGYEGIVLYQNGKRQHFTEKEGLRNNNNNFLYKTSKSRLFATGDRGLTEIVVSGKNNLISFKNHFLKPRYSQHATLNAIVEGPGNIIWCGGMEGLYYLKDDSLYSYNFTNRRLSVTDLKFDGDGNLWIVTESDGIFQCVFDARHAPVLKAHYTTKDGLNANMFRKILFDKEGNRWLTSYKGISFISKDGGAIINFDGSDIFPDGSFHSLFLYEDLKGKIWVGCSKGIASFNPFTITKSSYMPPVYITHVSLTNSNDDIFAYALDGREGLPQGLTLPHDKNYLRFQYVAIDYSNQQNLQYYYQLKGLDSAWINGGNQRSVIYQHLPAGEYSFNVKALNNKGVWSYTATYMFSIRKPFWSTWWFITLLIVCFAAMLFFIIKMRDKAIRRKAEMEGKLLAEFNHKFSESELKALRSQMNPHFVFNILNTIESYALENNKEAVSVMIQKFSRLTRLVLENSMNQLVPFQNDWKSLQLYIELEQMRYADNFMVTYHLQDQLLEGDYLIPPMIIQPFVENAIIHGLRNKADHCGVLTLSARLQHESIIVEVQDNGIGRGQAAALKGKNPISKNSLGIKVTQDRISIYNNLNPTRTAKVDIEDLHEGTKVIIVLPVN